MWSCSLLSHGRDDVRTLKYLAYCIKESLRLFPPVPVTGRYLEQPTEIGGHKMPKGTYVISHNYSVHHNPDVWEDPEVARGCSDRGTNAFIFTQCASNRIYVCV